MATDRNGTLYIGVTSDPIQRVWQHREDVIRGFTQRYGAHRLVWFETCETMVAAIEREKRMKKWRREWKLQLIEERNPYWRDLWDEILQ